MPPKLTTREAFLQSFIHSKYYLFGRELKPFCLRHLLLLVAADSPLIHGGDVQLEDLRVAVLICSTGSNDEFFDAGRFKSLYWRIWKHFTKYADVRRTLATFNQYIYDFKPAFPFWESIETSPEERVPGCFVDAAKLLGCCSPTEIMNMPLGELRAWVLALNEAQGTPNENLMTEVQFQAVMQANAGEAW